MLDGDEYENGAHGEDHDGEDPAHQARRGGGEYATKGEQCESEEQQEPGGHDGSSVRGVWRAR